MVLADHWLDACGVSHSRVFGAAVCLLVAVFHTLGTFNIAGFAGPAIVGTGSPIGRRVGCQPPSRVGVPRC